jgi:hypothetical protein
MLAALYRYAAVPARSRRIRKAPQRLAGAGHTGTAEDAKPGTAEDAKPGTAEDAKPGTAEDTVQAD